MTTKYEYYTTGEDDNYGLQDYQWYAQTFTVGATGHTITSVKLRLSKYGAPDGNFVVSIRATSGGNPTAGPDLTSGSITCASIGTSVATHEISVTEYTLAPNTMYAIVCRAPGGNVMNWVRWWMDYSSPTYSDGQDRFSNDSGSTWSWPGVDADFMFEIWGNPVPTPINVTDSGAGSEATISPSSTFSSTDSGAGVETPSLSSAATLTDSGAGTEGTPSIGLSCTDAGSGSESSLDLQNSIPSTDAGIGSEVVASLSVEFSITDANSTSDEALQFGEYKNAADSVSGMDAAECGADIPASDTGACVESVETAFTVTDLGANVDAGSIAAAIPASDSLTDTEILSFTASIPATDSGSGVDTKITGASLTLTDSGGVSSELVTVPGYPFITDSGVTVEVFSKQFDVFEEALAAEFAWRQKGSVLIDALAIPHVLSIRVVDDAAIVDKKLQGGLLPRRKMIGKPGRVVEIVGWSDSQSEIDALEALADGTARTFYHPSGDSFAVLVRGFNPDQSVDEYDRRVYRLSLVELRSW